MSPTLLLALSVVFWACLFLLAHTYVLYPALMRILSSGRALPDAGGGGNDELPEIAVLMAVYNEETVLEATLASILASNYPAEKLRVHIGSDGSTDGSDAIVRRFAGNHPQVSLRVFGGRNGKIRIVNQLAEEASAAFSDPDKALYVLCDANVVWTPSLLRNLARHFERATVGLVGTAVCDRVREHAGIGDEEEAYIGQENLVKFAEGVLWGKVMGVFGACYAIRARLFAPVPVHHLVDDFYLTLSSLEQGAAAIVDLEAVCYEAVSTDIREEFRRKRRIATGNFQNLVRFGSFLLPWNGGLATTFAFWSHKGLRWCGPFLLLGAILSCLPLAILAPVYLIPLAGFALAFVAAFAHRAGIGQRGLVGKICRLARYFLSMNFALFLGFVDFVRGPRSSVWEPTKRVDATSEAPERAAPDHGTPIPR